MIKTLLLLFILNLPSNIFSQSVNDRNSLVEIFNNSLGNEFINFIHKSNSKTNGISQTYDEDQCVDHLDKLFNGVTKFETWALQVIDSWGKIPSGIFWGHMKELGNYEECISVTKTFDNITNNETFKGQYCTAFLPFDLLSDIINSKPFVRSEGLGLGPNAGLSFGICVPNICKPSVVDTKFKEMLKSALGITIKNTTILLGPGSCIKNDDNPFTALYYVGIAFFSIIGVIMLLSTIYDYAMNYYGREPFELFIAFSVKTNGARLFKIQNFKNNPNVIECLNGIRCLSIIWVVFGHQYGFSPGLNFINPIKLLEWSKTPFSVMMTNGTLAVDSFFLLSGCLLLWAVFKEMEKSKGKLNVPLMYFHRYIRLTPVVAAAVLWSLSVNEYLISGPFSSLITTYTEYCEKNWWSTLLYVQNYVNPVSACLPHTWYLAVDTHFYILSPLILIPLWKWGKIAFLPGIILSMCSIAYVFTEWMIRDFHLFTMERGSSDELKEQLIYTSSHARFASYFIGIVLGYCLFNIRNKNIKLPKWLVAVGWLGSVSVMMVILFGLTHRAQYIPNSGTTTIEGAVFESFSRVSWNIALSWIVFACHKGYGGIVNTFLSWGVWQPLGRLSYSIYIIHAIVQMIVIGNTKVDSHFSDFDIILAFWSTFGFTVLASIGTVLAFELPILGIEKVLFTKKEKKSII